MAGEDRKLQALMPEEMDRAAVAVGVAKTWVFSGLRPLASKALCAPTRAMTAISGFIDFKIVLSLGRVRAPSQYKK